MRADPQNCLFECPRCGVILECPPGDAESPQRCPSCAVTIRLQMDSGLPRWRKSEIIDGEIDLPTAVHAYAAHGTAAPEIVTAPDGSREIICPRCAHRCEIDADRCPACGTPFSFEAIHTKRSMRDLDTGAAALALSLVGLACFPSLVISFLGMALSVGGLLSDNRRARGRSIAAVIFGGLGLTAGAAFWWWT